MIGRMLSERLADSRGSVPVDARGAWHLRAGCGLAGTSLDFFFSFFVENISSCYISFS